LPPPHLPPVPLHAIFKLESIPTTDICAYASMSHELRIFSGFGGRGQPERTFDPAFGKPKEGM